MSIIRDRELRALSCDRCAELSDDFDQSDFAEGVAAAKREGWFVTRRPNDEWEHLCPICARKRQTPQNEFRRR